MEGAKRKLEGKKKVKKKEEAESWKGNRPKTSNGCKYSSSHNYVLLFLLQTF